MTKFELNEKWGYVCDTDKLVDDVVNLLTKYRHDCTEYGVCEMLNVYFRNKIELIELLQKSDNYIGDMRAVVDIELERDTNQSEVKNFCEAFPQNVESRKAICKFTDENGKSIDDYMKNGKKKLKAKDLLRSSKVDALRAEKETLNKFRITGETVASFEKHDQFRILMQYGFRRNYQSKVGENLASEVNAIDGLSIVEGMKTSRAFNKVCSHYGVDKLPNYNRLFAQYADIVSGLKRKMKFFISVNPLDYLTMSFGNSWASCHTIDKRNFRNTPVSYHGEYCGGTVSYMLDKTSIITFVHNSIPEDIVEEGKIYRTMFHYRLGKLIQGRIYPQGNDGATDLYKVFRDVVQTELSKMLGLQENKWVKKNESCEYNTATEGVHYPDYLYVNNCNVTYVKEMPLSASVTVHIGHPRICVHCGFELPYDYYYDDCSENTGYLVCSDCD